MAKRGTGADGVADRPMVSVIVPCRNEERFIGACLDALLAQTYPRERIEILVADGRSTDGTRRVVERAAARDDCIRVIDNAGRFAASGLNRGIEAAVGPVIIRVDAHGAVATDFIEQNVRLLVAHPEAWSVGGPIVHRGVGATGRAIATAMSHPFGVGNARHRFADYEGDVDSVAFPAYRRSTFDRVGAFDERFVRNQDDELSLRIIRHGGRILVSTAVRFTYQVRERFGGLFRQYLQYGYWKVAVIRKHGRPASLRVFAPALLVGSIAASLCAWLLGLPLAALVLAGPGGAYATANLCVSLGIAIAIAPRVGVGTAVRVPVAFVLMHAGYGLGFAAALLRWVVGATDRDPVRLTQSSRS